MIKKLSVNCLTIRKMRGIVVLKNTINGDDFNEKSILDGRFHS